MKVARETSQTMQRVKVGMIGLAAVVLLIGLASAIMRTATGESPVAATDGSRPDIVANMAMTNMLAQPAGEPLAELGVAPSANAQAQAASKHP